MLRYHFWLGHFSAYLIYFARFHLRKGMPSNCHIRYFFPRQSVGSVGWKEASSGFHSKLTSFIVHFTFNLENWLVYDSFIWIRWHNDTPNGSISLNLETIQSTMTTRHQHRIIIFIIIKLKRNEVKREQQKKRVFCPVVSVLWAFLSPRMEFCSNQVFVLFYGLGRDKIVFFFFCRCCCCCCYKFNWPMIW